MSENNYSIESLITHGPKILGVIVGLSYVAGFIVVNSSNQFISLVETEISNPKYIAAGLLFFFFVTTYFAFPGRTLLFLKRHFSETIEDFSKRGYLNNNKSIKNVFWVFLIFLEKNIQLIFMHILFATSIASLAIPNLYPNMNSFWGGLIVAFMAAYTLEATKLEDKFFRSSFCVNLGLKTWVIYLFIVTLFGSISLAEFWKLSLIKILIICGLMAFALNLIVEDFEKFGATKTRIVSAAFFSMSFFVGIAMIFGLTIYEDIHPKIGGGKSEHVEISGFRIVNENNIRVLLEDSNSSIQGTLISKRATELLLKYDDHIFVIPIKSGIIIKTLKQASFLSENFNIEKLINEIKQMTISR